MNIWIVSALLISGYVASIYTWPKVKELLNGAETEIRSLEDKIKALRDKIKGAV